MRLIWGGEKLASSMPQRTVRRASRFFSLRLFFASLLSEESSPLSSTSDSGGTSRNLLARDWRWTWRHDVEKKATKGKLVAARIEGRRENEELRWRHRGHWISGRSTWAILLRCWVSVYGIVKLLVQLSNGLGWAWVFICNFLLHWFSEHKNKNNYLNI